MSAIPHRGSPAHASRGRTQHRLVGTGFFPASELGFTLPRVIAAGASADTEVILGDGFNAGMLMAACTGANLSVQLLHVDPVTNATLTPTRALGTVTAAAATAIFVFGVGSTGITTGSADVFNLFLIRFLNAAGVDATLTVFPGVWMQAR